MPERLLTVALLSSAVAAGLAVDLTAQGGRGAAARVGNDAMAMLRSAPISANPGEAFDIRESAPAGFPVDLLPEAAVVNVSSVSPSLSVVVATVESGRPSSPNREGIQTVKPASRTVRAKRETSG